LGQLAEQMYIAQLEGVVKTCAQAEKWATQWLKEAIDPQLIFCVILRVDFLEIHS